MSTGRRNFLKQSTLFALGTLAKSAIANESIEQLIDFGTNAGIGTSFSLPALPYPYAALEPLIDKQTMEIHHTRHHQAYVDNLNKALEGKNNTRTLEEILNNISKEDKTVRNNAGGHYNHSLFWQLMKPFTAAKDNLPFGKIAETLNTTFGDFESFKKQFTDAGLKRFGSGWAWLYVENKQLKIGSTPNQDNPLMDNAEIKGLPLLALDVWEHAYYLKYQNKRADYINNWWQLINWEKVNELFAKN